ncbi:MAG: ATP-binding protein [Gracilibacteraceae bacterium]|nr:ATP-binding protein [Gracilibacteraceae bacterium]
MAEAQTAAGKLKMLPIGIEDFEKLIRSGYYYVDKTRFIKELLDNRAEVTLFLRSRRFGKTLTLSTLQYFFEDTGDEARNAERRALFAELEIAGAGEEYALWQTSRPVIFLTLKSMKQTDYEEDVGMLKEALSEAFSDHESIIAKLKPRDRERFERHAARTASLGCLQAATGKKSIILIDEYDVPLDGAWLSGYYAKMVALIRAFFESGLKTNKNLEFAVITGCLRVSRESIFTGMNNLKIYSVAANDYGDSFGFTPNEVDAMLKYFGRTARRDDIRQWYDGYQIGGFAVYNPWSVVNTLSDLKNYPEAEPGAYWANSSSNEIVRRLIRQSDETAKAEMETLLSGGAIEKTIREDLPYQDLEAGGSHLWNFMLFTGYLTMTDKQTEGSHLLCRLRIPNREVKGIYEDQVKDWFAETLKGEDRTPLYDAILRGDAELMSKRISQLLESTISYYDYGEAFYHGFLAGILRGMPGYSVKSNRESGLGRADLSLRPVSRKNPYVVFEFKIAPTIKTMDTACQTALRQIDRKHYLAEAEEEGYAAVLYYGAAFFKKEALVMAG